MLSVSTSYGSHVVIVNIVLGYTFPVKTRSPYHHSDLRGALLRSSLELLRDPASGDFTLREVARRAGVSHNAPYRHFRDKDDLLAAIAEGI